MGSPLERFVLKMIYIRRVQLCEELHSFTGCGEEIIRFFLLLIQSKLTTFLTSYP